MKIIAITGRSGSGKSSVTQHYAALGYSTVDGDLVAREVTGNDSDCLAELVQTFGPCILDKQGALQRKELARVAFSSKQATQKLTEITHPYMIEALLKQAKQAEKQGSKLFFVDGAVIVGGIFEPYCDKIILITAKEALAVRRIVERDNILPLAAQQRLDAQLPESQLRAAADYVVENSTSIEELLRQADVVLHALQQEV